MLFNIKRYYTDVEGKVPEIAYFKIKKGVFKGIVFNFENIEFRESDDGEECKLFFNYTIHANPNKHDENDKKLKKLLYKILIYNIEQEVEQDEKIHS